MLNVFRILYDAEHGILGRTIAQCWKNSDILPSDVNKIFSVQHWNVKRSTEFIDDKDVTNISDLLSNIRLHDDENMLADSNRINDEDALN